MIVSILQSNPFPPDILCWLSILQDFLSQDLYQSVDTGDKNNQEFNDTDVSLSELKSSESLAGGLELITPYKNKA